MKKVGSRLGKSEIALGVAGAAYVAAVWHGDPVLVLLSDLALLAAGLWVIGKWVRIGIRRAIWRLRNRLIVAYIFIALVPVLLIALFFAMGAWVVAGQAAVYIVSTGFHERTASLESAARAMASVAAEQRFDAWARIRDISQDLYPDLNVMIEENGAPVFPAGEPVAPPDEGWGEISGLVDRGGTLWIWARANEEGTVSTVYTPLTGAFLTGLAQGLGRVDIASNPEDEEVWNAWNRLPEAAETATPPPVPPAKNPLDFQFRHFTYVDVADWDAAGETENAVLNVSSRVSSVYDVMFREQAFAQFWLILLAIVGGLFLIVEGLALVVGVSLTRTITGAVHDLYEATERVRAGNFSHRIEVKGSDQIATVSSSFNRMTENVERLLVVAKEKERIETELAIAHEVQSQLYPKLVPPLAKLDLLGICEPARTVSGDYYDYEPLSGSSAAIAIGDVAGKGISAALLMASMQSSLQMQVHASLEDGGPRLSPSAVVAQLNRHLYGHTSPEKYATFLFSVYDDETGVLTYTNAGHLPPIVIRNGEIRELDVNGMVVGAFPFAQYNESQIQLEPGDLLVAYTDGMTEPENEYGEQFGEQRLIELVQRSAHLPAREIIHTVMDGIRAWTGSPELQDDMTVLLARRL